MGNRYRFKLSDMMPNAWFYKLKDMNRASTAASHPGNVTKNNSSLPSSMKTTSLPPDVCPRKSYYFPRDLSPVLPEPPRRSSKQARPSRKSKPKPAYPSPPLKQVSFSSTSLSYRASTDSVWTRTEDADSPDSIFDSSSPELRLDRVLTPESLCRRGSRVDPRVIDDPDIVIDMDENSFIRKPERAMGNRNINSVPNIELPRIITKPKHNYSANHVEIEEEEEETKKSARKVRENGSRQGASRRRSVMSSSPRPRLKIKSPRLTSRRLAQARRTRTSTSTATSGSPSVARRNLSGSLAVVKSSFDPQRDFRESMVEMIVEHNIKATKDLEELLACYLSLNSDEYHELIIQVFKQIWFDLTDINSLKV